MYFLLYSFRSETSPATDEEIPMDITADPSAAPETAAAQQSEPIVDALEAAEPTQDAAEVKAAAETAGENNEAAEATTGSESGKDFMDGVLSINQEESNPAPFDEIGLVLGKDGQHEEFSLDGDKQEAGHPMLSALGLAVEDEEKKMDEGEGLGLVEEEKKEELLDEGEGISGLGLAEEEKKEGLMDEGVDLDSFDGATLLKVPTADGKVLLIPYRSEDGTVSLQLPAGMTLDERSLQMALEGAEHGFLQVEEEEGAEPSLE